LSSPAASTTLLFFTPYVILLLIDAFLSDFGSLNFYSFYQPSALGVKVALFLLEFLKLVFTAGIICNDIADQGLYIPSLTLLLELSRYLAYLYTTKFLSVSFRPNLLNFQL
jgi:hypothetical protein